MEETPVAVLERSTRLPASRSRGGSRVLRGGSLSQFKGRFGGWVTFAALGIPKGGHFRSFRSLRAKVSPRAFATAFADFPASHPHVS
eukprot:6161454-Prymnesium_polylepis.1